MSIVIDILLLIIFVLVVVFFTKFGLDRALLRIGNKWLSLACALIIGPGITGLLEKWFINDGVTNTVHSSLVKLINQNANGYNLKEVFENLPDGFVKFLDTLGANLPTLEAEFGSYTEAGEDIVRVMAERLATPCVDLISSLIGMILGFVIPWAFIKWLDFEIQKDRLPFFRALDHVGGFITGAASGYAIVLGIALLTLTIFQIIVAFDASVGVMNVYNKSFIFKFLGEFDTIGMLKRLFHGLGSFIQ